MMEILTNLDTKKEQERTRTNKVRMLEALKRNKGLINISCDEVGIRYNTHRNWMMDDETYKAAVDHILNMQGDKVESKLMELVEAGDTSATIFYCKTKLKHRGYTERTEITGKNGEPLIVPRSIEEAKKIIDEE